MEQKQLVINIVILLAAAAVLAYLIIQSTGAAPQWSLALGSSSEGEALVVREFHDGEYRYFAGSMTEANPCAVLSVETREDEDALILEFSETSAERNGCEKSAQTFFVARKAAPDSAVRAELNGEPIAISLTRVLAQEELFHE